MPWVYFLKDLCKRAVFQDDYFEGEKTDLYNDIY